MGKILNSVGKLHTCYRAQQEGTASTSSHTYDSDRQRRQGGMPYSNDWAEEGDNQKIASVLKKLGERCEPRKIPFKRYCFN